MKKTFEQWMDDVNAELLSQMGLTSDDLPDYTYYDAYTDGMAICDVVEEVMENAEYY